ncbi:hypothetical protein [Halalkalibacter oceani]|uniref:Uncharacterized protein n=1 Tax=Halalkalibacter oceani TaxID=1653776 RepID=A0A9X2IPD4_9BACI|nr:hypothetical protein [Halalkalibacter oceani]MCM3715115.1 hypothetical protein [Halalkalibacter oceani]
MLVLFLVSCSFSFTTAHYSDLQFAAEIDSSNRPVIRADHFTVDSPIVHLTGILNNAPDGTVMKAVWVYLETEPPTEIDFYELESVHVTANFSFHVSRPDNGWPPGDYEVHLYIDDKLKETLTFQVVEN